MVVSNAAVNPAHDSKILETQETVLDKLWEVNVKSPILILQVKNWHNFNGWGRQYTSFNNGSLGIPSYQFPSFLDPYIKHLFLQEAAPHLRKGSSVVLISSIAGYRPVYSVALYGMTKTALFGLTKVPWISPFVFLIDSYFWFGRIIE